MDDDPGCLQISMLGLIPATVDPSVVPPSRVKLRRLDQLLANLGHGSRRDVRELIQNGLVTVHGEVEDDPGAKVEAEDVLVEGEALEAPDGLLAVLHKPIGYICTHDEGEGSTIYGLLPERWVRRNPQVTSVGRLDKDTSGILLMTDRGELVQRWTSPKSVVEKVYEVEVDAPLQEKLVRTFASGTLMLRSEDTPCLPAKLEIVDELHARLTLTEGRYHQARRMFASQGWNVVNLHRSRFGDFVLGDLPSGEWRMVP
jgi:16S rRNA pseudouridine516 synthase